LEVIDYWVHCFPACFDPERAFLDCLVEFVARLSRYICPLQKAEWAVLTSLAECIEEKVRLTYLPFPMATPFSKRVLRSTTTPQRGQPDENKGGEGEGEKERKGGINALLRKHSSQLTKLNPHEKLTSALRAIHKSGSEKDKIDDKPSPASPKPNGFERRLSPTKKRGSAIMYEGLKIGYGRMTAEQERLEASNEHPVEDSQNKETKEEDYEVDRSEGPTSPLKPTSDSGVKEDERNRTQSNGFGVTAKHLKQLSSLSQSSPQLLKNGENGRDRSDSNGPEKSSKKSPKKESKDSKKGKKGKKGRKKTRKDSKTVPKKRESINEEDEENNAPKGGASSGSVSTRRSSVLKNGERRRSFMMRTLSVSNSVSGVYKSEDSGDHSKVGLSSGQSWANMSPVPISVNSAKEDIDFLTADPCHIARQLTLMDWFSPSRRFFPTDGFLLS